MTNEEIIEMVKKSGWSGIYTEWAEPTGEADWPLFKVSITVPVTMDQIRAFAKLIAEKECEECAKRLEAVGCQHCAENIRRKGQE